MKLYYSPGFCSLVPHIVAREAGIDLDLVKVDTRSRTVSAAGDFWSVNPKGYVPALELEDGQVLTEVAAIVQYLGDRSPASGLMPKPGTMEHYRLQEMLGYLNAELHRSYDTLFNDCTSDAAKVERREHLAKRYGLLEKQLAGRDYLFGAAFTVADAYLWVITTWARHVQLDLAGFPNLLAFQKRVKARPAVQAALRAEGLVK
jgi:glutathione S-transferase